MARLIVGILAGLAVTMAFSVMVSPETLHVVITKILTMSPPGRPPSETPGFRYLIADALFGGVVALPGIATAAAVLEWKRRKATSLALTQPAYEVFL